MEQYSKEFWKTCLQIHPMHLSSAIGAAISCHEELIKGWVDGGTPEVYGDSGWVTVPKDHHRFTAGNRYREATPKRYERDVVVYWRDAIEHPRFPQTAGIDVRTLRPEGTDPRALTLEKLAAKTPGFRLLSITRVVVDDNQNLTECTAKLDNLDHVPF